jgi:integrase/recombinase XerD
MAQYAELLALRFDAKRTRHAYYRAMRLLHEHFQSDPATREETHLRDYLLHIKLHKHWKPKTIRQTLACAKLFFVELLQRPLWRVFSQIRTKDHDFLPAVLTRQQVHDLLGSVRLRRYRTPIKLIYCCGLRLGECLSLSIHDILGEERKLVIRNSKGHQDRVIPLPALMLEDLQVLELSPASALVVSQCGTRRPNAPSFGRTDAIGKDAHALQFLAAPHHRRPQAT